MTTNGKAHPGGFAAGRLAVLYAVTTFLIAVPGNDLVAQVVADSTYTWQAYATIATCSISIYDTTDDDQPKMVIVREVASNRGPTSVHDATFLIDRIARDFGLRPEDVVWIFRLGSYSYSGATASPREILLRATVRRSSAGTLGRPSWRVVSRVQLEEWTDRAFM